MVCSSYFKEFCYHRPLTKSLADFLGIKRSASQEDINKAFRKKSRLIHPDKAKQSFIASKTKATPKINLLGQKKKPGIHVSKGPTETEIREAVKNASERFARLGVIANILKGPGRERYDHFLANGFPKWKGTGYYYARFRPGLGSVLIGLFIVGGGLVHYVVLYLSWKRQKGFVELYIARARKTAWGDDYALKGIRGLDGTSAISPSTSAHDDGSTMLNRRQKRLQEKESKKKPKGLRSDRTITLSEADSEIGPLGPKKRVQAENGKVLIVDSTGNVFLEEEDENGEKGEYLLNADEIPKPIVQQTLLFRLPAWILARVWDSFSSKAALGSSNPDNGENNTNLDSRANVTVRK